jgi:Multiubiquitin
MAEPLEHEHHEESYHIQIDRAECTVHQNRMTGEQLRHVPPVPIPPDRDLFEVVPGGSDRKIANDEVVEIRNGLRFFTAPAQINPGKEPSTPELRRAAAD